MSQLNKLNIKDQQADALLGLALHTIQDYYAHNTKINVYKRYNNIFFYK